MRFYKKEDFKIMPWKNGGGSTTELLRIPKHNKGDDFHFRLSMATIKSSGPFSEFLGIDRILMLLKGDGFTLRDQNGELKQINEPLSYCSFEGETALHCDLLGSDCLDLNVMTERNWGHSTVFTARFKKGDVKSYKSAHHLFLLLLKDDPELIELYPEEEFKLEASESLALIGIELKRKGD